MAEHVYLTAERISEIKARIEAVPDNLDSQTRFVYRLIKLCRDHGLRHGLLMDGEAGDDWKTADVWANSSRDIRDLLSDLEAMRAKEQEACKYLFDLTGGMVGCGEDPIRNLIASHAAQNENLEAMRQENIVLVQEVRLTQAELDRLRQESARIDRWETGFRNIVSHIWGARKGFEISEIVELVESEHDELGRLRKALEDAPHGNTCVSKPRLVDVGDVEWRVEPSSQPCNCWKSRALNPQTEAK